MTTTTSTMLTITMTRSATPRSIVSGSVGEAEAEHKVPAPEEGGLADHYVDCHDQYDDHFNDDYIVEHMISINHDH